MIRVALVVLAVMIMLYGGGLLLTLALSGFAVNRSFGWVTMLLAGCGAVGLLLYSHIL